MRQTGPNNNLIPMKRGGSPIFLVEMADRLTRSVQRAGLQTCIPAGNKGYAVCTECSIRTQISSI